MALSTAVSVASFTVVLNQSFAAVAASSLVPATFVTLARLAKQAAGAAGSGSGAAPASAGLVAGLVPGGTELVKALQEAAKSINDIDVLVPKTAKISATFEFEGAENYSAAMQAGAAINVVSVNAGYSAMYSTSSKNRIQLDVDFVSVNYTL